MSTWKMITVDIASPEGVCIIKGTYHNKHGLQRFFLQRLFERGDPIGNFIDNMETILDIIQKDMKEFEDVKPPEGL